ncbi:hypothetical protein [Legionella spiritensis]|nr:hypothetical protein [Legionella spiritensis]
MSTKVCSQNWRIINIKFWGKLKGIERVRTGNAGSDVYGLRATETPG